MGFANGSALLALCGVSLDAEEICARPFLRVPLPEFGDVVGCCGSDAGGLRPKKLRISSRG